MRAGWRYAIETILEWRSDHGPRLSAALAYYALFALGPILLLTMAAASPLFGEHEARQDFIDTASKFIGPKAAGLLSESMTTANEPARRVTATWIGIFILIWAASSFVNQVLDSLNYIYRCETVRPNGILPYLQDRALSVAIVILVAGLLTATVAATTVLAGLTKASMAGNLLLWRLADYGFTFVAVGSVFTLVYRLMPTARCVTWPDAAIGGFVAAFLFGVLKELFGVYISYLNPGSGYGAAGSLVVLLLLVYFSAQVFFLGAELSKVLMKTRAQKVLSFEE